MMLGSALFRDLGEMVSDGTGCSSGCSELDLESAGDGLVCQCSATDRKTGVTYCGRSVLRGGG